MDQQLQRRDRDNREELAERIARALPRDGSVDLLPGLRLIRRSRRNERFYGVSRPSFCVIAQGSKDVYVGGSRHRYDADHYLLATAELPVAGQIVEATRDRPYLGLVLELDASLVGSVMVDAVLPAGPSAVDAKAIAVSPLDSELLDATTRLLRSIDSPARSRVLLPLLKREIVFHLLMGEQSHRLQRISAIGGHSQRVSQAIERLRKDFDKPLRIETLARELGMSASGFHHHFKAFTELSPLQFQKQIRLQEARRLMLSEELDASTAGYRVGYNNPSHFCRDYKRAFGEAPVRDIERLRGSLKATAAPPTVAAQR